MASYYYSSLIQVMACHLFSAKQLLNSMLRELIADWTLIKETKAV